MEMFDLHADLHCYQE